MRALLTFTWVMALAALASGCEQRSAVQAQAPTPPAAPEVAPAPQATGRVVGTVYFSGAAPVMAVITACPRQPPPREESVVVNANGTLKNVIVYVKDAPSCPPTAAPAELDQIGCQYVPHVIAVRTGQRLTVRSSDDTLHNVDVQSQANAPQNFGMIGPGRHDLRFDAAEIFRVGCDVHPWMSAYVGVFAHPYFAVTGDDGSFEIKAVPAGAYTLAVWQERYGTQEAPAQVAADGAARVNFTYHAP